MNAASPALLPAPRPPRHRPPHAPPTPGVWINEDNAHFYDCHPQEDMTEHGVRRLVDAWAADPDTRVAGMLLNVNVQRALFHSTVWEPLYHGYDPHGPDDQPALQFLPPTGRSLTPNQRGRWWLHNLWLLHQRGVDHPAVYLDQCRRRGVAGWLTMRMNDCHHNPDEQAFWHCTLWKQHPELRRALHRNEGWFEGAFDYGQPRVVEHHLALIRELCARYDFDGLELDWNRWVLHFRPGHEQRSAAILTDFLRQARTLTQAAARRVGHPVQLGVRLPSEVNTCLQLGYDVVAWGREHLVDQVTLAAFHEQAYFDWPLALWRALLPPGTRLLCQAESIMRAHPEAMPNTRLQDYALLRGSAAAALHRGADGIYLFNECYRAGPGDPLADAHPGIVQQLRRDTADLTALQRSVRRHPVSYAQIVGPGQPSGSRLPVPLRRSPQHWELGRYGDFIPVRLAIGPRPAHVLATLHLGFDAATPPLDPGTLRLWINSQPLQLSMARDHASPWPAAAPQRLAFHVPTALLHDDVNIVELITPPSDGALAWAELILTP